jgi:hypothetical protein
LDLLIQIQNIIFSYHHNKNISDDKIKIEENIKTENKIKVEENLNIKIEENIKIENKIKVEKNSNYKIKEEEKFKKEFNDCSINKQNLNIFSEGLIENFKILNTDKIKNESK